MKLMFIGAAHEVTGSCHYMNVGNKHILVDYGMEQGVNTFENAKLPVNEAMIDYVLLTHAHVDQDVNTNTVVVLIKINRQKVRLKDIFESYFKKEDVWKSLKLLNMLVN